MLSIEFLEFYFFFPASTNKIYSTLLTKSRFIRERERVIDITFNYNFKFIIIELLNKETRDDSSR